MRVIWEGQATLCIANRKNWHVSLLDNERTLFYDMDLSIKQLIESIKVSDICSKIETADDLRIGLDSWTQTAKKQASYRLNFSWWMTGRVKGDFSEKLEV